MRKNCLPCRVEFINDLFGEGAHKLAEELRSVSGVAKPRVLLVADYNVVQRTEGLGAKVGRAFQAEGVELAGSPVVFSGGDKVKLDRQYGLTKVFESALAARVGAQDLLVAFGGGAIFDVVGVVAAGLRARPKVVRIPTTPSAMLDAAFAEQAYFNGAQIKDSLTYDAKPALVLVDFAFADTVLDGVWRAGFAEAVRFAVVKDVSLLEELAKLAAPFARRERAALQRTVELCLERRKAKGGTAFALWAANRLEEMSEYKLPHGYAIALGIVIDTAYAFKRGYLPWGDYEKVVKLLTDCGAMDGASHSRHLLGKTDLLLQGLETARWLTNAPIELPQGLGNGESEENLDLATMKAAIDMIK